MPDERQRTTKTRMKAREADTLSWLEAELADV